jgi:hypothetical protein
LKLSVLESLHEFYIDKSEYIKKLNSNKRKESQLSSTNSLENFNSTLTKTKDTAITITTSRPNNTCKQLNQEQLNFNFRVYDIISKYKRDKEKNVNKNHQIYNCCLSSDSFRKFHSSLIDIKTLEHVNYETTISHFNNNFFILYFCSNFTTSNRNLFENVQNFVDFMRNNNNKMTIVLISSDKTKNDYEKLLLKYQQTTTTSLHCLALDYNCKEIKNKLYERLKVVGIPWFSLINANNGDVCCENLKIFILNSQMREMIC